MCIGFGKEFRLVQAIEAYNEDIKAGHEDPARFNRCAGFFFSEVPTDHWIFRRPA